MNISQTIAVVLRQHCCKLVTWFIRNTSYSAYYIIPGDIANICLLYLCETEEYFGEYDDQLELSGISRNKIQMSIDRVTHNTRFTSAFGIFIVDFQRVQYVSWTFHIANKSSNTEHNDAYDSDESDDSMGMDLPKEEAIIGIISLDKYNSCTLSTDGTYRNSDPLKSKCEIKKLDDETLLKMELCLKKESALIQYFISETDTADVSDQIDISKCYHMAIQICGSFIIELTDFNVLFS
eukprot:378640_1